MGYMEWRGGLDESCEDQKETDWGISQVNFFSIFIFENREIWIMWGGEGGGKGEGFEVLTKMRKKKNHSGIDGSPIRRLYIMYNRADKQVNIQQG